MAGGDIAPEKILKAFDKPPAQRRAQTARAETMLKLAMERGRRDRKGG